MQVIDQSNERRPSLSKEGKHLFVEGYTRRLYIRSYTNDDFSQSCSLYSNEELTQFFDHGEPRVGKELSEYIEQRGRKYFDRGEPYGLFSVFAVNGNAFLGQVDLVPTGQPGELEIGWIFLKQFQGQGYCTEAVMEFLIPLIHMAHREERKVSGRLITRVIATAHPENSGSNRVIEKIGMRKYKTENRYGGKPRCWYELQICCDRDREDN